MLNNSTLEVIKFRITPIGDKKTNLSLGSIRGVDLLDDFFNEYVKYIDELPKDELNQRTTRLKKNENNDTYFEKKSSKRSIMGVIETGRYGKEEDVVDSDDKKGEPVFKIGKNHSVLKPFFFLACIPEMKNIGLIMLERDGPFGIKSVFMDMFTEFIEKKFPKVKVRFSNFVEDKIIDKYISEGGLNTITLTRNSLPKDVADRYGLDAYLTDDYSIELKIKAKGKRRITGNARSRIKELFLNNPNGFFETEEFKKIGFDEKSKIKINSTLNDKPRTIDLSDTMKFRPYYNVNVEIDNSGHSEYESIKKEAISLMDSFGLEIY